jgi:tetratricopeptide (TPR) repeat protein
MMSNFAPPLAVVPSRARALLRLPWILLVMLMCIAKFASADAEKGAQIKLRLQALDFPLNESEWTAKSRTIASALSLALDELGVALLDGGQRKTEEPGGSPQYSGSGSGSDELRLRVRVEVQGISIRLGGSVINPAMTKALGEVDVEPVEGDARAVIRLLEPFAENIAAVARKLSQQPAERPFALTVGCFSVFGLTSAQAKTYVSELPVIIELSLSEAKNIRVRSRSLEHPRCDPKDGDVAKKDWEEDGVIEGKIAVEETITSIKPQFRLNTNNVTIALPSLEVEASKPVDYRKLIRYGAHLASYLDVVLSHFDRTRLGAFARMEPKELLVRGHELLRSGDKDLDYAAVLVETAYLRSPTNAEAAFLLGKLESKRGEDAAAVIHINSAIKLGWNKTEAAQLLNDLYVRNRSYGKAREVCERLIQLSQIAERSRCFGDVSFAEGKLEDAEAAFATALAEDPGSAENLYAMGLLKQTQKDTSSALLYYTRAAEQAGFEPAKIQIARLRQSEAVEAADMGQYEMAIERINRAIESYPSWQMYDLRGQYEAEVGDKSFQRDGQTDYKEAILDYTRAIQLAGDVDEILYVSPWLIPNLAELLVVTGSFQEARDRVSDLIPKLGDGKRARYNGTLAGNIDLHASSSRSCGATGCTLESNRRASR